MRIRHAGLAVFAAALIAAPAAAQQTVTVQPAHLRLLETRLNTWAAALPPAERALWDDLLRRAAAAPATRGEVRVTPLLQIGPGGGCEGPVVEEDARRLGIALGGDRAAAAAEGIIVQGGLTTRPAQVGRAQEPLIVAGGRPGVTSARAPRPGTRCTLAIGPKQDDPAPPPPLGLSRRLAALAGEMPEAERGALNWLLSRALASPARLLGTPRPVDPNDPRPAPGVSLRAALGVDAEAIGPKQDDPRPPTPTRWTLRY